MKSETQPTNPPDGFNRPFNGITYHQWLVGRAITGVLAADTEKHYRDPKIPALDAIDVADAVIRELEHRGTI